MKNFDADNFSGENHEGSQANKPLKFLTASSVMSDKVINRSEEKLGTIKDIMLDLEGGKIEYIVVEMGGFLGMGEKFFAIPFPLLKVDPVNHAFVLDQDKATLEGAPGFDKDHWPETNSHLVDASTYWGGFMGANTGSVPY